MYKRKVFFSSSSSYFFLKYININSLILKKNNKFIFSKIYKNGYSHFIFQYNFLNNDFMYSLRSSFFKYSPIITSSKKSVLRKVLPTFCSGAFTNSSFILSIPSTSELDLFNFYKKVYFHCTDFYSSSSNSRFSTFFFSIFFNTKFFPLEFFNFFFKNSRLFELCSDNRLFVSFIINNIYFKQFCIYNNTFFKK